MTAQSFDHERLDAYRLSIDYDNEHRFAEYEYEYELGAVLLTQH